MRWPRLLAWAAIVLVAGVLLTVRMDQAQPRVTTAGKYSQLVNDLYIPQRWLRLERRPGRDSQELVWAPPEDPEARRVAEAYLQRSYLAEDMERFNSRRTSADRRLFTQADGRLRVNSEAHVFASPFQQRGRWTGQLYYSGAQQQTNLVLQSLEVEPQLIEIPPLGKAFASAREEAVDVTLFGARRTRDPLGTIRMVRFLDAGQREIALAWRVGDGMVVQLKSEGAQTPVRVRINGKLAAAERNSIHHLPRRGVLLFENEKRDATGRVQRRAWVLREAQDPNLIYDAGSDVWHGGGQNPLMPRVAEVLSSAVRSSGQDLADSVTLTVSRSAEQAAAQVLRDSVKEVQAGRRAVPDARAAITLMDGLSGALLALPSWPESQVTGERDPDSLIENHNFTRLAPGSVVKVLYSAALLETHPELRQLKVNVVPEQFENVAGIPLADPVGEEGRPGWMSFTEAIAYSANRYAATLLTLGSVDEEPELQRPGGEISEAVDHFFLDGTEQTQRPANLLFEPGRAGILMENVAWAPRMRELYEISTASSGGERYRHYVWDGLPRSFRLFGARTELLDGISPATENLQLNAIDESSFRTRFLPLILGGGESRWTNVALAEAFSSIVANRRVRARLVAGEPARMVNGPAYMDADVRGMLLDGMRGVVRFGTASRTRALAQARDELASAACTQRGMQFELYGKTGTPELEDYVLSPAAEVFNQMARDGLFVREPGSGRISYPAFAERPLERKDVAALRAAYRRAGTPAARDFQSYFKSSLAHTQCGRRSPQQLWKEVFEGIVLDNNDKLDRRYQTVRGEGATLFSDRTCENKAPGKNLFGKHFVFVAALYDQLPAGARCDGKLAQAELTGVPAQVVAGVVAIEHVSPGEESERVATRAAARLLLGPVAEQLRLRVGASAPEAPAAPVAKKEATNAR